MPTFEFDCVQKFACKYRVEADTFAEAEAALLIDGEGECVSQEPGDILDVVSSREV